MYPGRFSPASLDHGDAFLAVATGDTKRRIASDYNLDPGRAFSDVAINILSDYGA